MAKSVEQLREQIAKLQAQERALMQKEVHGVIAKIKVAVQHYGLTAEQIFGSSASAPALAKESGSKRVVGKRGGSRRAIASTKVAGKKLGRKAKGADVSSDSLELKPSNASKGIKLAAKFKDEAGNSWSGRGSQPRWLRAAIEGGKKLEEFAVA